MAGGRRGRDLNPRGGFKPPTRLAGERLRPLGHLSQRAPGITWGEVRVQTGSLSRQNDGGRRSSDPPGTSGSRTPGAEPIAAHGAQPIGQWIMKCEEGAALIAAEVGATRLWGHTPTPADE